MKENAQTSRVEALREAGCWCPNVCALNPYACGCGLLVRTPYSVPEALQKLADDWRQRQTEKEGG